ncbi:uncharacterized protein LOC108834396 [Raphanus sativus]|uniref:Uncharacterized protein LOC108834396 n=1 Tax=Raphanus sativus TaxID=3726 RepID=A0A6J0LTR6_RAPSA|nr:uncharacterized protein LOC108834396 [Raphanus sativus]
MKKGQKETKVETEMQTWPRWLLVLTGLCLIHGPNRKSSNTWEALKPRHVPQDWYDIVWFKGSLPKHAFTMWIANYDKLPTKARLASWGVPVSPLCSFCSKEEESRDHLLLSCDYSQQVWSEVFARCQPPASTFTKWAELLSWIRHPRSKRAALLRKLAAQTVVFHLWKQRNNLNHNQISLLPIDVFKNVDRELKNIISSMRETKSFKNLMVKWIR